MNVGIDALEEVKIDVYADQQNDPPLAILPENPVVAECKHVGESKKRGRCYALCDALFKDVISQVPLTLLAVGSGGYGAYQILNDDNVIPGLLMTAGAIFQLLACCRIGTLKPLNDLDQNVRILEEQLERRQEQNIALKEKNAYFSTTAKNLHQQTMDYGRTISRQNQSLKEAHLQLESVMKKLGDKVSSLQNKLDDYNELIQEVTRLVGKRDYQNQDAIANLDELAEVVQGLKEFKKIISRRQLEIEAENEEHVALNNTFAIMLENLKNHMSILTMRFEHQKTFISSLSEQIHQLFEAQEKEEGVYNRLEKLQANYNQLLLRFKSLSEDLKEPLKDA
ncbi:MAG: hypothetical protein WD595_02570 [Waddliaceae bacterium]